jgi:PAS domain S-box-containing protein
MHDAKNMPVTAAIAPALQVALRAADGILDLLPIATCVCDARGTILQYNRHAIEIWGRVPLPGQTHEAFRLSSGFRDADGKPAARSLLADVLATGRPVSDAERVVQRADGTQVVVSINIDPLHNAKGELVGAIYCFRDITERRRMDDALEQSRLHAREQEQRLAATYEHAAIGITEASPDGRIIRVNEAICAITGYSREYLLTSRLFDNSHPDDIEPDREAFRKQAAGDLEFYSIEKRFVRRDGRVIWVSVHSSPVRDAAGRLLYLVRVVQDVTERKAAEQRQRLLIDELNHRVKNTLATVQSLASQTVRSAPTPAAFRESFEGRLLALSKAHDQLTMHHWESAELRALLTAGFAPYGVGPERVVLRGEDLVLRPRAVLTLAMAFHELITNAAKYGALSTPAGRIEIRWEPMDGERAMLHIEWREAGGPPVAEPAQRGFGSRLIEGGIAAELGGRARLIFAPEGLRCEIDIPLETVRRDVERRPGAAADWSI